MVAVVYCGLSLLALWPILPFDGTHLPQHAPAGDPQQMSWFLSWGAFAFLHGHNPFLTNYLDYPTGVNLAGNTLALPLGIVAIPVTEWLGPIASFNLLTHVALAGSALSMFLVLRSWTHWWPAAFTGGLLFGFGSYLQSEGGTHLDLAFLVIPPILVWCLERVLLSRRIRPLPGGALLGILGAIQFLIDAEILADLAIVCLAGLILVAIRHRDEVKARRRDAATALGVASGCFVVVAGYPLALILWGPQHLGGPFESVRLSETFRQDLLGPVIYRVRLLIPGYGPHGVWGLRYGYFGVLLLGWLIVLAVLKWRHASVRLLVALAVVAFVLSLGSTLSVDGLNTHVPLPSALLQFVPLLDNALPVRFAAVETLFVAALLAVALDLSYGAAGRSPFSDRSRVSPARMPVVRAAALLSITALAMLPVLLHLRIVEPQHASYPGPDNPVSAALTQHVPAGGVVLTVPQIDQAHDTPMLWQAQAQMHYRLVGGYAIVPGSDGHGSMELSANGGLRALYKATPAPTVWNPRPAATSSEMQAARCELPGVLRTYDVSSVVAWDAKGADLGAILRLLEPAMGAPQYLRGGVAIWYDARARPCG